MSAIARWTLISRNSAYPRSSHCLAASSKGRVALYGGEHKPRTPVDVDLDVRGSLHIFDAGEGLVDAKWQTTKAIGPVPEPRVGAATTIIGDYLYLWGGRGGVHMSPLDVKEAGIWRCSIAHINETTRWERVTAVNENAAPQPRSYHTMTSHADKLYIHAGCPASGRVGELHSFDLSSQLWKALAPAPEPGRGGTVIALTKVKQECVLLRFAGFAGYELGADHTVDLYNIATNTWNTTTPNPDVVHGFPGPRSVHGLVGFTSSKHPSAVALLYHGERDASTLGHAGAGTFWSDVWLLEESGDGFAWRFVPVQGEGPEARGWFPSASWVDREGNTKVVLHGGLLSSNERSDESWSLDID